MKTVLAAIAAFTVATPATAEVGRYQLMSEPPITVLDTVTGKLWVVEGNAQQGYLMRPRCYQQPDGTLTAQPENPFADCKKSPRLPGFAQ